MAKRVITNVVYEDDLTGDVVPEESLVTQRFTYDGVQYEIDLSNANADTFRKAMDPWTQAARKVGGATKKKAASNGAGSSAPTSIEKNQNREIRDWARTSGLDVPPRGRIPASIREAFEQSRAS